VNGNRSTRRLRVVAGSESLISSAGGALLLQTAAATGLDRSLRDALRPWRGRPARHDPGKVRLDLDATIVLAHSEKEGATPTWKRTFGFHPLLAFLDHGPGGTGEQLTGLLRVGKATANDAADHIAVLTDALAQLPVEQRSRVLVRGDSGAGVNAFLHHLHTLGLHYSVGVTAHHPIIDALAVLPRQAWRAALDADGQPRDGAQVAELTRWLRPARNPWPPGMRVTARRERPHPGAQLRLTDADGWRITVFATNVKGGRIADHELLHRQRTRCEDRIRCAKDPFGATCRCTASPPTSSGWRSLRSPATCSPGPSTSRSSAPRPGPGNRNGCAYGC